MCLLITLCCCLQRVKWNSLGLFSGSPLLAFSDRSDQYSGLTLPVDVNFSFIVPIRSIYWQAENLLLTSSFKGSFWSNFRQMATWQGYFLWNAFTHSFRFYTCLCVRCTISNCIHPYRREEFLLFMFEMTTYYMFMQLHFRSSHYLPSDSLLGRLLHMLFWLFSLVSSNSIIGNSIHIQKFLTGILYQVDTQNTFQL